MRLLRTVTSSILSLTVLADSLLIQHILERVSLIVVGCLCLGLIHEVVIGRGEGFATWGILLLAWVLRSICVGSDARSFSRASLRVISLSIVMLLIALLLRWMTCPLVSGSAASLRHWLLRHLLLASLLLLMLL